MRRWSRCTSPRASRSAGSAPGRRRASTLPTPTGPRASFAIAHPPPNVTGDLHLGHALQLSLADTIVRTRRMQGFNVLWQPGYDHAGISTQNAVEKHLATEGKTRHDLGREAFEERVWEWLREYGGKIMIQFRRIGASLDYRRERFTMDEAYVRGRDAVLRPPLGQGLDLPGEQDRQLVPVPPRRRSRISRSRTRTSTTPSPTSATRSPTATGTSRSRPRGRRRSLRTSPSPSIPRTTAIALWSDER